MTIFRVNHIAVVVPDVEQALGFWRDALGLELARVEHNEHEGVNIAFLLVGEGEIELIAPTSDESGVARYLSKTGGGLHHICVEVDDIAAALESLKGKGVELINEAARTREDGIQYAFVHPRSTAIQMFIRCPYHHAKNAETIAISPWAKFRWPLPR